MVENGCFVENCQSFRVAKKINFFIFEKEVLMPTAMFDEIIENISELSYVQRLMLLSELVRSLYPVGKKDSTVSSEDLNAAFGLWKDRDVSLSDIRAKAWR